MSREDQKMTDSKDKRVEDLALLLLYVTSWEEREFPGVLRSWKGYPFEVLDSLTDRGLIRTSKTAKSVSLTDEGIRAARNLEKKYLAKVNT